MPYEKVKKFLEQLKDEDIIFKEHFYKKIKDRPIDEDLVREYLRKTERLQNVEKQSSKKGEKYKLWIKLSNRYSLVVIVVIIKKDLYIITSWNTNRKWQKSIQL